MALVFPAPAQIKNLLDPTANTDAATKQYVDSAVSGGATTNFTANSVTANTITVTANIVANTATTSNLGNVVIANYFTGSGNNLSNIQAANITGTVANANYAAYAGNITIAAQPNITSVGTLASLSVTGNITSGNANLGNLVTANYFSGDGSLLTGLSATSSNYANYAGNVVNSSQPNITSVGTLSGLTVSGSATITGNLVVAGNTLYVNSTVTKVSDPIIELGGGANGAALSANDSFDRGTLLHYYTTTPIDAFMGWQTANSEFVFASNANVTNNAVTINTLGNIRVGNANLGNAVVANYFIGSGANLTSINGSNVTGQVANALVAGTVYTNAQPNITAVGILSSLTTGTHTVLVNANIAMSGSSSQIAGGNLVSASYLTGTLTTGVQPNITSIGTLSSLTITGNITSGNANLGNAVTANYFIGSGANLSAIAGANVTGQVANALVAGTVYTNAQPNITSVGTLTSLSVTGNITSGNATLGNLVTANYFSGSGNNLSNIQGANVTGQVGNALVAGTVYTGAQPNITSVGTLSSLTVSGTTNLGAVGNITITGGTTDYLLKTDGAGNLSWTPPSTGTLTADVDSFIGDGSNVSFTLANTPAGENFTIVAVQGVLQPKSVYSLSGNVITFSSAPNNTAVIEVTTFGGSVVSGGGSNSAMTWSITSSNGTMSANKGYFVDTSSAAITMTLPSNPILGDTIRINDLAGTFATNNLTVARNGKMIQGSATDLLVDTNESSFGLVYSNSTYGWKVLEL